MNSTVQWPWRQRSGQALITVAVTPGGADGIRRPRHRRRLDDGGAKRAAERRRRRGPRGASALYKQSNGPPTVINSTPNWTRARDSATNAIAFNKVNATRWPTAPSPPGCWNLTGTPAGMQSRPSRRSSPATPPRSRVIRKKRRGQNGGPVGFSWHPCSASATEAIRATAVAVVSYPSSVAPHETFPTAINNCMYDAVLGSRDEPAQDRPGHRPTRTSSGSGRATTTRTATPASGPRCSRTRTTSPPSGT